MNKYIKLWKTGAAAFLLITFLHSTQAADWYVALDGAGGGTSWADATNSIQGAIIKSAAGDTIWVNNGVYDTGGITNYPSGSPQTNRVVINKAVTVRSKDNDPANTIIKGAWDAATNGPAAVRCVYMSAGSLIGFTLTNGATLSSGANRTVSGGGVCCPDTNAVISNCVFSGNSAYGEYNLYGGGGACNGTLRNCLFTRNSSRYLGGGAYASTMYDCILSNNFATSAGGAFNASLYNCVLSDNYTPLGNSSGGGSMGGTLRNCIITRNRAGNAYGGGSSGGTLYNCLLSGNSLPGGGWGGGAYNATLYNCTVVSNSAARGGGVQGCALNNCIVYFNTSGDANSNWYSMSAASFTNTCTAPSVAGWAAGNITGNPMFVNKGSNNYHLVTTSACFNAGTNFSWMTNAVDARSKDLDGKSRVQYGIVDMGAYETILGGIITIIH